MILLVGTSTYSVLFLGTSALSNLTQTGLPEVDLPALGSTPTAAGL